MKKYNVEKKIVKEEFKLKSLGERVGERGAINIYGRHFMDNNGDIYTIRGGRPMYHDGIYAVLLTFLERTKGNDGWWTYGARTGDLEVKLS